MAFWQKLEQKATATTVKAMQKARDFSDVAKYTTMLADEEKRINDLYLRMGQLYAALYANNPAEPFVELLQQIQEANRKKEEYQRQIQEIKGMRKCPQCGADVPSNSAFCSNCGKVMTSNTPVQLESSNMVRCASCGAMVQAEAKFCTACGSPMVSPQGNEEGSADYPKVCPNCGAAVENGATFCTACGTKL